jgi:hypothetical protein
MNRNDVVFIVGDSFELFSTNQGVMTISHLLKDITENDCSNICDKIFAIGQGVQQEQLDQLVEMFEQDELSQRLNSRLLHIPPEKGGSQETHKRKPKNIVVSQVRARNDTLFEANLLLDDRNECLDDHVTGQHLPGMVLIEAGRQIAFLITEQFFLEPDRCEQAAFVLHDLNTTFHAFTFPVDVLVRYEILEKNLENPTRLFFSVLITFLQAGRLVAEIRSTFTVAEKDRITSVESTLARRALQQSRSEVYNEAELQEELTLTK